MNQQTNEIIARSMAWDAIPADRKHLYACLYSTDPKSIRSIGYLDLRLRVHTANGALLRYQHKLESSARLVNKLEDSLARLAEAYDETPGGMDRLTYIRKHVRISKSLKHHRNAVGRMTLAIVRTKEHLRLVREEIAVKEMKCQIDS